nr:deoxyribose-phosphate aldolase [Allomuricauda sp.]
MRLEEYIDHTLLKPTATELDIMKICKEAIEHKFKAVCVQGCHVPLAKQALRGTPVQLATVVGFPLGGMSLQAKVQEAKDYVDKGADEIDMVINIGWLKSGLYEQVQDEIFQIKQVVGKNILKVILETCYLTAEEKKKACNLAVAAGADYIKTSTGFGTGGATFEDVLLIKDTIGEKAKIKASGGIKNREEALKYIEMGVSRIGTSSGIQLIKTT